MAYVEVEDVDATAKKAVKLGGKIIVEPKAIPNVGRFAVLQDPQGAAIAIHHSDQGMAPNGEPEVGQFSWNELATTDHKAAFDFYSKLFGWNETQSMDMGEMGIYQMYGQGEQMFGGMFDKPDEMPGPPAWLYYTLVDDIDEAVCKVLRLPNGALQSKQRAWAVSHPRMVAMFLARKHTASAYSEIGKHFGGRNHSTAVAAEKKVNQWLQSNGELLHGERTLRVREVVELVERELLR